MRRGGKKGEREDLGGDSRQGDTRGTTDRLWVRGALESKQYLETQGFLCLPDESHYQTLVRKKITEGIRARSTNCKERSWRGEPLGRRTEIKKKATGKSRRNRNEPFIRREYLSKREKIGSRV